MLRPYAGFAFTKRGIRPYCGLRLSLTQPKHRASHIEKIEYRCSICNAINRKSANFCNTCGASFH